MDLQLVETIIIILDGRRNILDGGSPDLGEAPRARRSRCAAAHATRRSEDPRTLGAFGGGKGSAKGGTAGHCVGL